MGQVCPEGVAVCGLHRSQIQSNSVVLPDSAEQFTRPEARPRARARAASAPAETRVYRGAIQLL